MRSSEAAEGAECAPTTVTVDEKSAHCTHGIVCSKISVKYCEEPRENFFVTVLIL